MDNGLPDFNLDFEGVANNVESEADYGEDEDSPAAQVFTG